MYNVQSDQDWTHLPSSHLFIALLDDLCIYHWLFLLVFSASFHFSCIHSYDKKNLAIINRGVRTLSQSIVLWIFMRFHIVHSFERFWIPKEAFWRFYFLEWLHSKYWPFTKVAIKHQAFSWKNQKSSLLECADLTHIQISAYCSLVLVEE